MTVCVGRFLKHTVLFKANCREAGFTVITITDLEFGTWVALEVYRGTIGG